jgi:hypothetical protein
MRFVLGTRVRMDFELWLVPRDCVNGPEFLPDA